jgi:hypothetical protein
MIETKKGTGLFCMIHANMIWDQTRDEKLATVLIRLSLTLPHSLKLYVHIAMLYLKMKLSPGLRQGEKNRKA